MKQYETVLIQENASIEVNEQEPLFPFMIQRIKDQRKKDLKILRTKLFANEDKDKIVQKPVCEHPTELLINHGPASDGKTMYVCPICKISVKR